MENRRKNIQRYNSQILIIHIWINRDPKFRLEFIGRGDEFDDKSMDPP